jgi:hypothetical protein
MKRLRLNSKFWYTSNGKILGTYSLLSYNSNVWNLFTINTSSFIEWIYLSAIKHKKMVMKQVSLLKVGNLMLVLCLLVSCNRGMCPGFPADQADWLPYRVDNTVKLYDKADNKQIILPINAYETTPEQKSLSSQYNTPCLGPELVCNSGIDSLNLIQFFLRLDVQSPQKTHTFDGIDHISVEIHCFEKNNVFEMTTSFIDTFYADETNNYQEDYYEEKCHYRYLQDSIIDGNNYQHVIIIENSQNQRFDKIIIAKGAGMVQLGEKNGKTWGK